MSLTVIPLFVVLATHVPGLMQPCMSIVFETTELKTHNKRNSMYFVTIEPQFAPDTMAAVVDFFVCFVLFCF
jgi:hypothetical protein